jgi:hypothetical protein
VRLVTRLLLALCAVTWWVLPGMGLIDLSVSWDPDWPVVLEAGWGLLFTIGLGLPFLLVALVPASARAALAQLYVVTACLVPGVVAGLEPESWWIFVMLALQIPLVHAVAPPERLVRDRPDPVLLVLALVAAPVALGYAWEMASLNRMSLLTADVTNSVDHYSVQSALGLVLVALPAAASLLPGARRLLASDAALMAAYLGLVSYCWPSADGGFGPGWSLAVMGWSLVVLATAWGPSPSHGRRFGTLDRGFRNLAPDDEGLRPR